MFPTQLCLRQLRITTFTVNVILIETDLREIGFEVDMDSTGTG